MFIGEVYQEFRTLIRIRRLVRPLRPLALLFLGLGSSDGLAKKKNSASSRLRGISGDFTISRDFTTPMELHEFFSPPAPALAPRPAPSAARGGAPQAMADESFKELLQKLERQHSNEAGGCCQHPPTTAPKQ